MCVCACGGNVCGVGGCVAPPHTPSVWGCEAIRVDTKWRFQFFVKYDYRFLLDVIIAIIATFFAKAIIAEYFA